MNDPTLRLIDFINSFKDPRDEQPILRYWIPGERVRWRKSYTGTVVEVHASTVTQRVRVRSDRSGRNIWIAHWELEPLQENT